MTQVLRLDPRAVLVPLEHDHTQVTLIDPARPLDELMPIALANRPDIASRRALIQAAEYGVRMEKARPFIPNVLLNGFQTPYEMIQAGIFGLGPNSAMNQWKGRFDFSIQPLWQLNNMGLGNLAAIKSMRGVESMAIIDFFKSQDAAAADVTRAVRGCSRRRRAWHRPIAPCGTGIITFNGTFEGLQQTQPPWQCLGPGKPAAGSCFRPPALERGVRRVLHHGRRVQPGAI